MNIPVWVTLGGLKPGRRATSVRSGPIRNQADARNALPRTDAALFVYPSSGEIEVRRTEGRFLPS